MIYLLWVENPEMPLFLMHLGCLSFIFGFMWFIVISLKKRTDLYFPN